MILQKVDVGAIHQMAAQNYDQSIGGSTNSHRVVATLHPQSLPQAYSQIDYGKLYSVTFQLSNLVG